MQSNKHTLPLALPMAAENEEASAALKSTFAIASVGIATLNMLETLLPAAASEVEVESKALSANFLKLIKYVTDSEIPPKHISDVISNIIVGMQFQDRNTQIMDNVACILERYRSMLEDVCRNIEATRDTNISSPHNISKAVDDILSSIRLSDIRTRYMEALAKAKVHSNSEDTPHVGKQETSNEIELF